MNAAALLREANKLDVRLSVAGDKLHVDAPKGTLSPDLVSRLKAAKPELMALLSSPQTAKEIEQSVSEFFEERAGIAEFDGGLSREEAEAQAKVETERHRRECWERHQRNAERILSLPTWEAREQAIERYGREAVAQYGDKAGATMAKEMTAWIRFRSGLTPP